MNNAELIKGLKDAEAYIKYVAPCCYASCEAIKAIRDAADALEAAEKRIAELEAQLPWVESVMEDKLRQRIDDLENDKTNLEAEIINLEIALDKAHCKLEARLPRWTMLKDEMPKPHTNVLVSGIEAINNSRVYKVMVNDNGTLRPTDYAPSIRWDYWMPFGSPNCGAKMDGKEKYDADC